MRLEFEPNVAAIPLVENEAFEHLGHREQHDLDFLLKKGISSAQAGDRSLARQLLTEASEVDPSCETAWMWLASISEYPEELLAFLDRVLDINPANDKAAEWRNATNALLAKTFVQRAIAAREEGPHDQAEHALEQALSHDNDCIAAWLLRAEWAEAAEDKVAAFEQVLRIDPENEQARGFVAEMGRQQSEAAFADAKAAANAGKRKKALELVDEFLRTVPDNAEAWVLRSHLAIDMDDKIQSLEEALKIDEYNLAARAMYDFLTTTLRPQPTAEPEPEMPAAEAPESMQTAEAEPSPEYLEQVEPAPEMPLDEVAESIQTAEAEPPTEYKEHAAIEAMPSSESDTGRSIEEIFGTVHEDADPAGLTVESVTVPEELTADETAPVATDPFAETIIALNVDETAVPEGPTVESVAAVDACPFCRAGNDPQAFECGSCHAFLTLADLEVLFAGPRADRETVQQAVTEMEAEWNLREFSVTELKHLALGHFNLGNTEAGLKYLQEAARFAPNDVMLAAEVNSIAIRLDEMQRQAEMHGGMPTGRTILVVDDSPTVRKLIAGKLEKSGHTVICAADGVEALEQLEVVLPDLVLLDITMPRMDGYEVCKQIRSNPEARDLPVVMISGKDGFFDKVRGRMAGTTGYVTKPFGPETLMKALETYLVPNTDQTQAF